MRRDIQIRPVTKAVWLFTWLGSLAGLFLAATGSVPAASQAEDAPAEQLRTDSGSTETTPAGSTPQVDGITFADATGTLYAPLREVGEALGMQVSWNSETKQASFEEEVLSNEQTRALVDGTQLIPVRVLEDWSAGVTWDPETETATIAREDREVTVSQGEKRVAISLDAQELRAWQGERLVLETRVSSGRPGMETPTGSFTAGPLKRRMLISHKYNDAKMPWSVQVRGDVVIHGYPSVPPRAASHGCIRLPLTGANPAHWFYTWVETGTPIRIADGWPQGLPEHSGSGTE